MKKVLIILVAITFLGAVFFFLGGQERWFAGVGDSATDSEIQNSDTAQYTPPPIEREYNNERYRFSIGLPTGFSVQELENEQGGHTIVLQDTAGNGIQIHITPDTSGARTLSGEDVRFAIPDMRVTNEQPVSIGVGNTGVAFMSDNDAFGGSSREVWFYFGGNLYQISTYARLDALLQSMFGTWKFY